MDLQGASKFTSENKTKLAMLSLISQLAYLPSSQLYLSAADTAVPIALVWYIVPMLSPTHEHEDVSALAHRVLLQLLPLNPSFISSLLRSILNPDGNQWDAVTADPGLIRYCQPLPCEFPIGAFSKHKFRDEELNSIAQSDIVRASYRRDKSLLDAIRRVLEDADSAASDVGGSFDSLRDDFVVDISWAKSLRSWSICC